MTGAADGTQLAIPPQQWTEARRRRSICGCGRPIKTCCFGWVHEDSNWVTSGTCADAVPKDGR
ncbi:hypothetical protein GCM10010109_69900 [Actinoplanes campanulatus]|nr:hypothetical protein GCM10010109_69900 [Actinoplanes campanulatus]GID40613.1 hypothetical protein Aca09nite_71190 [Actinoplanes campanulatus]